jgi:2'-hydroxyisoflavone reductase
MKILIIGGTRFSGRALSELALSRGHTLTLFTRGKWSPDLFPEAEKLRGDRTQDLSALKGRAFDAVVDMCGYFPRDVLASTALLASSGHYTFISSVSVYADATNPGLTEDAPLGKISDEEAERVRDLSQLTEKNYGPLKARCEAAVERAFGDRALVIRPGLIVGPNDPTDRFTYWPRRVARGGEVLAPDRPELPVQFVDARDLAAFTLSLIEARRAGAFHVAGPEAPLSMGDFLAGCKAITGGDARFTWASEAFLLENKVEPFEELPLWVSVERDKDMAGFQAIDLRKALGAGLALRPVADTIRDTLAWDASRPPRPAGQKPPAGLTPEREAELLAAWHARRAAG